MSDLVIRPLDHVPEGYRLNVGIVLVAADGRVFAGQRADVVEPAWQMPQGGIDPGEPILEAAFRELTEETGVERNRADLLDATPHWLAYDLPPDLADRLWKGRYRGQAQKWVALRFTGTDADIDLAQPKPEFSAWRWIRAGDLAAEVIPFKRPIYRRVFERFRPYLAA